MNTLNLNQFCELPDTISPEQAQELTQDLSTKSLIDIPKECRADVEKFLCDQLMLNAVQPELVSSLNALVKEIQETA